MNDELVDTFFDEITEIDDQGYFNNAAMTANPFSKDIQNALR